MRTKNTFSYLSSKTYVVGTQKNRHNETVLLSTKKYDKTDRLENIYKFTLKHLVYLNIWTDISHVFS